MSFNKVDKPLKGDLLRVHRKTGYYHFGIAVGNDRVIHYAALDSDFSNKKEMKIVETPLEQFVKDGALEIEQPYSSPFTRDEVVNRAKKLANSHRFRRKYYNLVDNNCEHFARYCYYDKAQSKQVMAAAMVVIATGATLTGTLIAALALKKAKRRLARNKETKY